jgi:hypothetical protein
MVDARPTDGFIAIGTHGNGVYSTWFNAASGIGELPGNSLLQAGNIFPNPVSSEATLELVTEQTAKLRTIVYSSAGKLIKRLPDKTLQPGKQFLSIQLGELSPGSYYLTLDSGKGLIVRKVLKVASN